MKFLYLFICLLFSATTNSQDQTYTASTPADNTVRIFLGIPLSDSIDFIRWKFIIAGNHYQLDCNYGISKPNTNGFINDGIKLHIKGVYQKEKSFIRFTNNDKFLHALELNSNVFYLTNNKLQPLIGNAGWSYAINKIASSANAATYPTGKFPIIKDSIVFLGRTGCKIPGLVPEGRTCYKIKWKLILYADKKETEHGTFKNIGTLWRSGPVTGTWSIVKKNNKSMYVLRDQQAKDFVYLLPLNENLLLFTDAGSKLLVGDEDFSYVLNQSNN